MQEPKRILHIVGAMNRGGTETMLMNLYRHIDKEKIQFDFVSFSQEEAHYDKEIISLGGKIIRISPPSILNYKKAINDMKKVIKEYGPYEVVHAHTLFNSGFAMKAAKELNIKTRITHAHTTLDNESTIVRKIYTNHMRKSIIKNSTHLLACSNEAGRYLFGEKSLNNKNYTFFSNLIDYNKVLNVDKNKVEEFKDEYNLKDKIVIGHVGTLKQSKNQKFLIEITNYLVKENKDIRLLLVGDGSMRHDLEEIVKKYNLQEYVVFTGIREDVEVALHSMNIFAFPSIYEGLGLVLLEAQSAGLPCLVSEAIQPEADLGIGLVKKLNLSDGIEKWSQKVLSLAKESKLDSNIIAEAFENSDYSVEKCLNKLFKIYSI